MASAARSGEFNTAFAGVPEDGNPRGQAKLSRGNAETLCGKMRDDGIEIFTKSPKGLDQPPY